MNRGSFFNKVIDFFRDVKNDNDDKDEADGIKECAKELTDDVAVNDFKLKGIVHCRYQILC
jgi:hypothetical protein